jgi:AraC-like DNA-binding protein
MTITHNNMVPCLFTKGVEFVAVDVNKVQCLHDRKVLDFENLPGFAYETIKKLMGSAEATLQEMEVFAFNRWGGVDSEPDIDEEGRPSDPEYLTDYAPAYYDNGQKISDGEMRVLKLIDLVDKAIADRLCISPNTVARHFQSMFANNDISFKGEQNKRNALALWATKKGII